MLIDARDVADSVGLPGDGAVVVAWCGPYKGLLGPSMRDRRPDWLSMAFDHDVGGVGLAHRPLDEFRFDLSNEQTAFGVALKLDEWERAGGGHGQWAKDIAHAVMYGGLERELRHMHAALTRIAMDHRIRRALGWEVEAGTLATLDLALGVWRLTPPSEHSRPVWENYSLPGITDPLQALEAIHDEVTDER